jgi:hypothetical protein
MHTSAEGAYVLTGNDGKIFTEGVDIGGGTNTQVNSTAEAETIYANWVTAGRPATGSITGGYNVTSSGSAIQTRTDWRGSKDNDFTPNESYPGIGSNEDFLVRSTFSIFLPVGEYTLHAESDDGFSVILDEPNTSFSSKFGSGASQGAANEIRYNGTTGNSNTGGVFNVAHPKVIDVTAIFFERGGGDYFEVAIASGDVSPASGPGPYAIIIDGGLSGAIRLGSAGMTLIPEPATLLVWSLLASMAVGLGWRRRK